MTAAAYKASIKAAGAFALKDSPNDADLRCRLLVAYLAGSFDDDDKGTADLLRTVYQSGTTPTGDQA